MNTPLVFSDADSGIPFGKAPTTVPPFTKTKPSGISIFVPSSVTVVIYLHSEHSLVFVPSDSVVASLFEIHSLKICYALPLTSLVCSQVAAFQW